MAIALTGSAISVIYAAISGASATFRASVDPPAVASSLAVNSIITGFLVVALAMLVARTLRRSATHRPRG